MVQSSTLAPDYAKKLSDISTRFKILNYVVISADQQTTTFSFRAENTIH